MTIGEAIRHCEEVAEEQEKLYNKYLEEEITYRLTKKVEEE